MARRQNTLGKRPATLSENIIAAIRDGFFARQLLPGQHIGSEASIAEDHGVSRMAARDAIRALVAQGIVTVHKGAGGGVRIAQGEPERFADALAIQLRLLGVDLTDLIEAQIAAEAAIAELAAERATAQDIAALRAQLAKALTLADRPLEFTRDIMEFHFALADVSRNLVLTTLLRGVLGVLIDTYGRNTTLERARGVIRTYTMVVDAIAERDGAAARVLMRSHLRNARANLAVAGALGATGG